MLHKSSSGKMSQLLVSHFINCKIDVPRCSSPNKTRTIKTRTRSRYIYIYTHTYVYVGNSTSGLIQGVTMRTDRKTWNWRIFSLIDGLPSISGDASRQTNVLRDRIFVVGVDTYAWRKSSSWKYVKLIKRELMIKNRKKGLKIKITIDPLKKGQQWSSILEKILVIIFLKKNSIALDCMPEKKEKKGALNSHISSSPNRALCSCELLPR